MMRRIIYCLLFAAFMACYSVHGQNDVMYIRHQIDSLDHVQPVASSSPNLPCRHHTIKVYNQSQFDNIDKDIRKAIDAGENNIKVVLSKGVYRYKNNHILIGNGDYENVSIVIDGNNSIVTSDSEYSEKDYNLSPWDDLRFADRVIEVVDADKKLCLISFANNIADRDKVKYKKVQVTQWYKAPVYDVVKIDNHGIYFTATEIKHVEAFGRKGFTVNYDFLYSGKNPRFRMYDADKERKYIASTFLRLGSSKMKMLCVEGIQFRGAGAGASVFEIRNVVAGQIIIRDCKFNTIKGSVLSCVNVNNVIFEKCVIKNTAGNEVSFTGGCKNVKVVRNLFENCGQGISNTLCIRCSESEYYIADNLFRDFGYCAIAVGLWHGHKKTKDTKGIIEHNEIYFTPAYAANKEKYTLMDGGAIYVWTQNDDAMIRYNYIHDYVGMRSYSGIYCDDGASNCKIYGNVVLNTPDGCSITSRKVGDLKGEWKNNMNNFMANNIVDGSIVFDGYGTEERHCKKGINVRLSNEVKQQYSDRYSNLEVAAEDVSVKDWSLYKGKLKVPREYKRSTQKAGVRKKR